MLRGLTWSLVRVLPVSVAVVRTLVPSLVSSTNDSPKWKSIEEDLKVEEVSMPILPPARFLLVALG